MRSVQDRIMLILGHFGKERIETLFKNEDLFFVKGCLFSTDKGGQSCSISAHFSLSETSYASHDFAFDAFRNRFKTPLSNVENDETKILRIEIYDRKILEKNEIEKRKKYNIGNIFTNNTNTATANHIVDENRSLIEVKKKSFFRSIIDRIKNILKR